MLGLLLLVSLIAFGVALWWLYYSNKFIVEPNNRERLVVQDVLTGTMNILGPGTHFLPVWWKEMERVDINRAPRRIPPSTGGTGEEFRTSDGIIGLIEYRFDIVAGREYDQHTGQLLHPDRVDDAAFSVRDDIVISAVTRIDYKQHADRVLEIVQAAIESELGNYTSLELFNVHEARDVEIPKKPSQILQDAGIQQEVVHEAAGVYRKLSQCIEARANKMLTFVGINIVDFSITNLKPKSEKFQENLEQPARAQQVANAASRVWEESDKRGDRISYREALVATDPTAFGEVTRADAERFKAKSYADSAQHVADAISQGMQKSADAISAGIRNFGRGT